MMMLSPSTMRLLLVICVLGMALLAVLFLRHRRLSFESYLGWGLVAIFFPLIGPFWIILRQPGGGKLSRSSRV
jgi:hypothetical protein